MIRKREDVSQYNLTYKTSMASQILLKIEEYRRMVRKQKVIAKNMKA